jgi:hypothetical protein
VPEYCGGDDLRCAEQVFTMTPDGWPQVVPVRYKVIYDPSVCSKAKPCPLLFKIGGGGGCPNNYVDCGDYARRGFVVATVDPFCETSGAYFEFPTESSQFVEVKRRIFDPERAPEINGTPVLELIAGSEYFATGCSHGAFAVASWAFMEEDFPARTFAQSGGFYAYHCAYHQNGLCPKYMEGYDERFFGGYPHSESDPLIIAAHERIELVEHIDSAFVASREFGASWGVDLSPETPMCNDSGRDLCFEEGVGITYAARRLRDVWQRTQPEDAPTGYFFENQRGDCLHCHLDEQQKDCVACFLHHGRGAMAQRCPSCLDYPAGGPVSDCDIDCTDNGCVIGHDGDGGIGGDAGQSDADVGGDGGERDAAVDAGAQPDARVDRDAGLAEDASAARDGNQFDANDEPTPADQSGCGCNTVRTGPLPFLPLVLIALCLRERRRRLRGLGPQG